MMKFFRKIRFELMEHHKTGRYLKYAIGEILLVVIGILIALQINNWNEARKIDRQRLVYLENLKSEFSYNLTEVDRVMESAASNMENAKRLTSFTGDKAYGLDEGTCIALMGGVIMNELQVRPSTGALVQILSTGNLGIFHNEELKQLLASWEGALLKVRSQEEEYAVFRNKIIQIISEKGNWRNHMDVEFGPLGVGPSNLNTKNLPILQSSEFENYLVGSYATGYILRDRYYAELRERILNTLSMIELELGGS